MSSAVAMGPQVVDVVTDEPAAAACLSRGVVSTSVTHYTATLPKDIPYGQGRITLRWNKFRWRCREDYRTWRSFTEVIAQIPARARSTLRIRTQKAKAIGDSARSVAVLTEPEPTSMQGIDETRRGKPRWERCSESGRWVRVDPWDTGFVDLDGDQGL